MAVLRISGFSGENRALHPLLLADSVGVTSRNQKPGRGDLRAWKSPLTVATVPAGRKTIYRMGRDVASDANYWLSWGAVVHAVRGFDEADATERTYYTGDGAPKVIDNVMALASFPYPTAHRSMGIPAPVTAPLLSIAPGITAAGLIYAGSFVVGRRYIIVEPGTSDFTLVGAVNSLSGTAFVATGPGAGNGAVEVDGINQSSSVTGASESLETRYYTYTYVSNWGWESAPAPPSAELSCRPGEAVTILNFAAAPSGNYGINRIRIYRTQATSGGGAEFFFLREVSIGTASTTDENQPLGEVLPTATWLTPPTDLTFLTALWNGMLAGISEGTVRFCEPYTPYAWPIAYDVMPPDSKAVALGVFGQSLLVLTNGRPLLVSGSGPEAMDQIRLEISQGCIATRSVVSMGAGVAWASSDGLCWYGAGGARILTAGLMLRDDWLALKPASIVGCMYEGLYFGSYDDGTGRKGFLIDPSNPSGLYFLDAGYEAMHFDELQDQLYVLSAGNVQRWDAGAPMSYTFKSKVFRAPRPTCFSCAEVTADAYPVTVKVYADGALKHTQAVQSAQPFRLPAGFMASEWQFELSGTAPIQGLAVAHTMQELAQT